MPRPGSDERGVDRFRSILDPGLLLGAHSSSPLRDKGKRRAEDDGKVKNDMNRIRGKRAMSRVNSLLLSTESPRYTRRQPHGSTSADGGAAAVIVAAPTDSSISTIRSFGSRSVGNLSSIMENGFATKDGQLSRLAEHCTDLSDQHTYSSDKRRRVQRGVPVMSEGGASPLQRSNRVQKVIETDSADEEWDNIWGRWDDKVATTVPITSTQIQTCSKISAIHGDNLEAVMEDVEKSMSSSQLSQLSIQSDDGRFRSQMTFYQHIDVEQESFDYSNTDCMQNKVISQSTEWAADSSRSRIDEGLLMEFQSDMEDNAEEEEEEDTVQHRIEMLCMDQDTDLVSVRYVIFRGDFAKGECHESKSLVSRH